MICTDFVTFCTRPFLLGAANPIADATSLLPTVGENSGALELTFSCLPVADRGDVVLKVEHSSDLGVNDAWTGAEVPDSNDGPTNGVTFTVSPGGGDLKDVTASINVGEAAGGKLFGRLQGLEVPE